MAPTSSRSRRFLAWLDGLRGRLELGFIIYPIEGIWRAWYHLNPRIYSERLRIRQITEGRIKQKSDRYVLFVVYAKQSIPAFIETILQAIGRSRLNLVISTNARITEEQRNVLLDKCNLLIERADLGRDFGGYRDGIRILQHRCNSIERLILLNDSLFYFENGLDALVEGLDGEHDVIGMTEVFEHHYHIGSYAISVSRAVLLNPQFQRYWKRYRPIPTRRWSIHKGEVGLSRMLMKAGFKPHILYHGAQLTPYMRSASLHELMTATHFLPNYLRNRLFDHLDQLRVAQTSSKLSAIDTLSRSVSRLQRFDNPQITHLRLANTTKLLSISHLTTTTHRERERVARNNFVDLVISTITTRNQIHVGGFLFVKYLSMPAFKRDIFYRDVYGFADIDEILSSVKEPMRQQIMADLRQKGSQSHFKGLTKILAKHGSI
jgi:Rhamnan synthesis protein F